MNRTTSEGSEGLAGAALDGVLAELCDLKRTALLASPYLAFETRFLGREGNELRMWATMSRSMVENTLTQQALRIRFPWALSMWAGFTRVLGYEQGEKQRFVRLAVPERIGIDELRGHYRTDQCGRSGGTLGSESLDVVRVSVENLSAGGGGPLRPAGPGSGKPQPRPPRHVQSPARGGGPDPSRRSSSTTGGIPVGGYLFHFIFLLALCQPTQPPQNQRLCKNAEGVLPPRHTRRLQPFMPTCFAT